MSRAIEVRLDACVEQTRCFWDETVGLDFLKRFRRYVAELLPEELALARECNCLPELSQLPGGRCDVLVLLVGHSFEPLLQAICAYGPTEVVPVLNREYGPNLPGTQMRRRLGKLLPKLKEKALVNQKPSLRQCEPLPKDTPSAVFRFLLEQLKDNWEDKSIVIDITGAKKSMVAGAFFFAAYSNTPISYVDFDRYDEDYGRPYGCTCSIGLIDNPYRDFRLRDWARVRRLYQQYAFATARQTLGRVCAEMDRSGFFQPLETEAARKLLSAIEVYQAWDNGDYRAARQKAREPGSPLPEKGIPWAIQALGDLWPHADEGDDSNQAAQHILNRHLKLKHGDPRPEDSIFAQPEILLAYVQDELAKIERLIEPKEEYRAAYLRAVGLDEFLLKARLALCWLHGELVLNSAPVTRAFLGDKQWREKFTVLTEQSGADAMRGVLLREPGKELSRLGEVKLAAGAPTFDRYWQGKPLDLDAVRDPVRKNPTLIRLRGEGVHTHLYLTKEIADASVALARASVKEFIDNWLGKYHRNVVTDSNNRLTRAPGWDDLCRWCGIDFLPPYHEEDTQ